MKYTLFCMLLLCSCGGLGGSGQDDKQESSVSVDIHGNCNHTVITRDAGQSCIEDGGSPEDVVSGCCELLPKKEDDDCLRDAGFPDDLCRQEEEE